MPFEQTHEQIAEAHLASGFATYVWRAAEDRVDWSEALCALFGVDAAPDTETTFLRFVHPDDRVRVEAETSAFLDGGDVYAHSFRILRPDGAVRLLLDHGRILRDPTGAAQFLLGLNVDLTDAPPDSVAALAPNPTRAPACAPGAAQDFFAEDAGVAFVEWDIKRDRVRRIAGGGTGRDDRLDALDTFARTLASVHPADREAFRTSVDAALADPAGAYRSRFRVVSPDGGVRRMAAVGRVERDAAGEPARLMLMSRDLTAARAAPPPADDPMDEAPAILASFFDAAPIGLAVWDRDLRFRRVNAKLAEINGLPEAAHIGRRPDELLGDLEGLDAVLARWRRVIESGEPWLDVEISGETPARPGETRHWREHFFPVRAGGRITGLAAVVEEITEQRAAEQALRESAATLRRLLDGALAMLGILDRDGLVREVNVAALSTLGLVREGVLGRPLWDCVVPRDDPAARRRLKAAVAQARRGRAVRFDSALTPDGGAPLMLDVALSPVAGPYGDPAQIVVSAFDVTRRQEDAERIETLMREIGHRSKNLLALVQAMARQSARGAPKDFAQDFSERLQSLAATQDLVVAGGARAPVSEIVRAQIAHIDPDGERVRVEGDGDAVLEAGAAQALGMAIHELATNAVKHGALSDDRGRVSLCWTVDRASSLLRLVWSERDGPPVAPPTRRGFGSAVLDGLLRSKLDAEVSITFPPEGAVWRCEARL